jgi:hypothetical protein
MELHVSTKALWVPFFIFFVLNSAFASSCEGLGTVFFFGNGMFTTKKSAEISRKKLEEAISRGVSLEKSKDIQFDIAYKTNEFILTQVLNVALHKRIDNWESFWLWLSSLKKPPQWFQDQMVSLAAQALDHGAIAFNDIQEHFEQYSRYIRQGYNIVLVSHSQGNFYADQTMRKLSEYTDASLTGSLKDKRKKNSLFPELFDLFGNVQVATPVVATINSSPWSTFKDDLVMQLVRKKLGGALPANLKTPGIGLPPDGDLFGHFFVEAYLRNSEAKQKILSDIQAQYTQLKYPIGYFDQAVLFESHWRHYGEGDSLHSPDVDMDFNIVSEARQSVDSHDEVRLNPNEMIQQTFANCYELPLGTSKVFLSVDSEEKKEVSFDVWPDGRKDGVKRTVVKFQVERGISDWEVGVIEVGKGIDKEPLQVKVEIYPQPKPRSKKDRIR